MNKRLYSSFDHLSEINFSAETLEERFGPSRVVYEYFIVIPRVNIPELEPPIMDQIFTQEIFFNAEEDERIVFPENNYVTMYKRSLYF